MGAEMPASHGYSRETLATARRRSELPHATEVRLSLIAFWPHLVAMLLLGGVALHSPSSFRSLRAAALLVGASLLLACIYRFLPSGVAPPLNESIGWKGWAATLLTVSIPLLTVTLVARLARRRLASHVTRAVASGVAGVVALVAYPMYGLVLYCGFTGICP